MRDFMWDEMVEGMVKRGEDLANSASDWRHWKIDRLSSSEGTGEKEGEGITGCVESIKIGE